ncbi:DUF362 domain-containing protein [Candidatus Bipolaricaulota bacterium]|nr:DUF362 domain-containing protein [Candidatus Bipolaricaulota bacterium]
MTPQSTLAAAVVAAVRCETYDDDRVHEAVLRGFQALGGAERFVQPGERIVLKPNLLAGRGPERAVTTHPSVFRAVARVLGDAGVTLQYGDSPGFGKTETIAGKAGLASVARDLGISVADFQSGETVSFLDGDLIKQFTVAKGVLDADGLISLPKMKTHGLTRITGAIKNQFGCIPGTLKAEFHARLPNADQFSRMLVDLNRLLHPRLFVMDGIVAMEGNGPQAGVPRAMNVLLLSEDPVALDATFCRLVKLDPALVPPIVHGARQGLGVSEGIHYVGDPIDSFVAEDFDVNRSSRSTTGKAGRYSRLARRLVVPKPVIQAERCIRCGTCVEVCPVTPKAVMFEGNDRSRPPVHHYDRCIRCYCCQEMCPESAIKIHVPLLGRTIHHR